jgi:hypothetical protein
MSDSTPKKFPALATVALKQPILPTQQQLADFFKSSDWPGMDQFSGNERLITFDWKGKTYNVALMDAPIPWSQIEGPCKTAWWWPDATTDLKRHVAHALVLNLDNRRDSDAVEMCMSLTKVVAAVAATTESIGIYWGNGTVVHTTEHFVAEAKELRRELLPLQLWIDFRIENRPDGRLLFTTGMTAFGHKEIEVQKSKCLPRRLLDVGFTVALYLLKKGPVLKHGDTIGSSMTEKIPVKFGPSYFDRAEVLLLDPV